MKTIKKLSALAAALMMLFTAARADWKPAEGNSARFSELFSLLQGKDIGFEGLVEPVKYLYKDEVRKVGRALGIPAAMVDRQPFPGPGLAVRCIGELTKEKLDILREADYVFRSEMAKAKLDRKAQQFFAIMTNVKSTGVKNGARTFGYVIALRAVATQQFVKAGIVELPFKFMVKVAEKIATTVKGVNRVVWDITPKPPSTIEWE